MNITIICRQADRGCRWVLLRFVACLVVAATAYPAAGQDQDKVVAEIRIDGNQALTDAYILQQLTHVIVGKPVSLEGIRKDVDQLKLTGKFADVFATTEPKDDQLIVIFHVAEKAIVTAIQFEGARQFKHKDLLACLTFVEGDVLDKYRVQAGTEAIADKYRDAGMTYVTVTIDEATLETGEVIYQITEGPRVRVKKINFEGQTAFGQTRLSGQIGTKTSLWILRKGLYSEKQIQDDILSLKTFYRKHGYLDVQVGRRLDFSPDRRDLTVTFVIEEGLQYTVGQITVEGQHEFTEDNVLACMNLRAGDILFLDRLETDRQAIGDLYHQAGFIYANVETTYAYTDTPGTANLSIKIAEGKAYKVGRILIRGNKQTQDRVIRRTLDFYPGEMFDMVKVRDRERRLGETRLFSDVRIQPVQLDDTPADTRDALIQVEEGDTTMIIAGVGVTSNSGVIGNISIESWNFDLFDWPRSFGEFFRGQSFKGAGQTLRLALEPGTELMRLRLDFREPYLFDRPLSFGTSIYLFDRSRDGYNERRAGTVVSLGKRFKKIYAIEGAARFEGVQVDDIDDNGFWPFWTSVPEDILDVEGWNFLTSLKLALVRDTTDSFLNPTQGTRMEAAWEQAGVFGGDFDFARLTGQFTHHYPVRTDVFGRRTVWTSNVGIGYIAGDAPVFERFYGGGIGSIRGFRFRGISPREGYDDTQVGGQFELLVGNELVFPVAGENLRGVVFLDMGTIEDDISITDWRASVGFGLRLIVPFLGPVPMSFDFAWPIAKAEEDDTQVFSFSLGATFK